MLEGIAQQILPTSTGFAARQTLAVLRKRNLNVAPMLHRVGLSERAFDDTESRISANAQAKLLEYAAEELGDSAFGVHLAQQANLRERRIAILRHVRCKTLGEAVPLYARYCRIVTEGVRLKTRQNQNDTVIEASFVGLSPHQFRQNVEFLLAVNLKGMRENAGRNVRPINVRFAHLRTSNLREFERFFGCPIEYGFSSDPWSFSNETLAMPHLFEDSYLLATLQPFCDQAAKERNTHRDPTVFSREPIAEAASARQSQQISRGRGGGDERANIVS
jgi:Arabinose-binding domain of AraC transcription regulator, N-term